MKKLKLLLIGLFGLIGLSSFCSAGSISDYVSGNILFSGSKSFSSAGYTNVINYGDNGAGTYCIKFTSSSPQTLTMGFANGGTTAPSNLYSLYNDQYGNWICLYGNKPYLNVKLNSSSNTINYEIFNLEQFLSTNTIDYLTFVDYSIQDPNQAERTISSDSLIQGYKIYFDGNNVRMMYGSNNGPIYFNYNDDTLIEKSQVNTGYCTGNNLCPISQNTALVHITDGVFTDNITFSSGNVVYVINQKIDEIQTYGNNIAFRMQACEECEQCQSCPTIDQEYCVSNDLCPSCQSCPTIDQEYCENNFNLISPSNCPVCSGGVSNWSSLWINNIQHLGASSIYMSIPEEIDRDYSYSGSGEIMEIDVEGYNVDYDYINGVVDIQKYKPSSEDFTNIVSNLGAYFKILLFLVFAFLIIRRISKPFRSKIK